MVFHLLCFDMNIILLLQSNDDNSDDDDNDDNDVDDDDHYYYYYYFSSSGREKPMIQPYTCILIFENNISPRLNGEYDVISNSIIFLIIIDNTRLLNPYTY